MKLLYFLAIVCFLIWMAGLRFLDCGSIIHIWLALGVVFIIIQFIRDYEKI